MPRFLSQTTSPYACVFALCAALTIAAASHASVTIHTTDGRVLHGDVDARTDKTQLWIRHEEAHIVLATPVAWTKITDAAIDGDSVSVATLTDSIPTLATAEPELLLTEYVVAKPIMQEHALAANCANCRIASVEIEALLVNRDRDVEPDGIELLVAAVDAHGIPMPVRGNLYVRLWGERDWSHGSLIRFEDLQRWSKPVARHDFVDGVANYFLPFRTVRPAHDLGLRPEAIINVRLGVTGEGNFEASAPVAIRHFNPMRDRLQLFEGSRYFRDELTSRTRHRHGRPVISGRTTWSRAD